MSKQKERCEKVYKCIAKNGRYVLVKNVSIQTRKDGTTYRLARIIKVFKSIEEYESDHHPLLDKEEKLENVQLKKSESETQQQQLL